MNIELYIDNQLCEVEDANKLSIALKRQFINPAELSSKDAQKSYDITLPATTTNNHIFGFKNVEEVKGKFTKTYDAKLLIKGVEIFNGKFRLNQITKDSYKGNLGVPAGKTVKDIFGDTMMNQIKEEWVTKFDSYPESLVAKKDEDIPDCFYPYVLYGLLPKQPDTNGNYTDKEVWDSQVKLSLEDFPPSINCLEAVKRIFASKDYSISGSAFSDERLKKLYMSYKNPTDYQQRWNYRKLADFKISGDFYNYQSSDSQRPKLEFYVNRSNSFILNVVNYNVLTKNNLTLSTDPHDYLRCFDQESGFITIKLSAVYEIMLDAVITIESLPVKELGDDIYNYSMDVFADNEKFRPIEFKLLKFTEDNILNLKEENIDRVFGKPNINQDNNNWNSNDPTQFPKYFPQPYGTMLIDPSQNEKFVVGFSIGLSDTNNLPNSALKHYKEIGPNIIVGTNSWSWDSSYNQEKENFIVTSAQGYKKIDLNNNNIELKDSNYNQRVINNIGEKIEYQKTNGIRNKLKGMTKVFMYLQKGEKLALINSNQVLYSKLSGTGVESWMSSTHNIPFQKVSYSLSLRPVMYDKEFVNTITDASTVDASSDVREKDVNLVDFLPSDVKINEWMDNFCKAFNLNLIQTDEKKFELNIKKGRTEYNRSVVDLDQKTHVNVGRINTSFNLPSSYDIGFTINEDEEGYAKTKTKGSEIFETGNIEGNPVVEKSNFSYTWYKDIEYTEPSGKKITLKLPVITNKEIWEDPVRSDQASKNENYEEMMKKVYTNLAQRFWYKGDTFPLLFGPNRAIGSMAPIQTSINIALTRNNIDGVIELDYTNNPNSILNNYFKILTDNENHYTTVECYLTPKEYNKLPNSFVKFNGDLYYVAEIDKYDPTGNSKTTLKLIRKIV